MDARARSKGGKKKRGRSNLKVDSYLPVVVKSASGLSLMVGDTVYDENGEAFVVLRVEEPEGAFQSPSIKVYNGGAGGRRTMKSDDLFHFKPVKCADDRVLKHGQIVWPIYRDDGPFVVDVVIEKFVSCYKLSDSDFVIHVSPCGLSHDKPVVDAKGIRVDKGDTVYSLVRAREYEVLEISRSDNSLTLLDKETGEKVHCGADRVTHIFPDSFERIEYDANKSVCDYFDSYGSCSECPQFNKECTKSMRVDLVRRCKKVVEMMPYDER